MTTTNEPSGLPPPGDELRRAIAVGRMAMKEAIEFAAAGWDYRRKPRRGEDEVWTAREVAEHALASEITFAGMIAESIGVPGPQPHGVSLPDVRLAAGAVETIAATADAVFDRVEDAHLELETRMGRTVRSVLKLDAWHLHDHAQQIVGVR